MGLTALFLAASLACPAQDALAVWLEYGRLCAQDLWPGFEPCGTPVLLWDGARTWLCGHPAPPAEFAPVAGAPDLRTFAGQHAEARANTSIVLAGVPTATYLLPAGERAARELLPSGARDARELAAGVLHEAFHVYQRGHHPEWSANEAELFLYPAADGELLAARREESEALRRALAADGPEGRGWAALACALRRERAARMAAGVAYERASELNEGLAQFVQFRAVGRTTGEVSAAGYAPEDVRERAYDTGEAWALLLERCAPGWPTELEARPAFLDELLARALADEPPAAFTAEERAELASRARADAAELERRRADELRACESAPGWRIELVSAAEPLSIQGFDPLNVTLVAADRVLHGRWLKLGNALGSVELLDRAGLTESAGAHPLFAGVKRLLVTGLAEEPRMEGGQGAVTLAAQGVTLSFRQAALETTGKSVRLVIGGPASRAPTWTRLESGSDELLVGLCFVDEQHGFAVGGNRESDSASVLLSTTDAGETWRRHDLGLERRLYGIDFPTPRVGYVAGFGGTLLKTSDGGETWQRLDARTAAWLSSVSFATADLGLVAGGSTLLRTRDGGTSWTSLVAALPEKTRGSAFRDVLMRDERTAFLVGDPGVILRTDDGGDTWRQLPSGVDAWLRAVHFTPGGTGFIAGTGVLLRSQDGGETWQPVGDFAGIKLCDVAFAYESTGYTCGFDGAVHATTDGGTTWNVAWSGATGPLNALAFPSARVGFAAGDSGTLLKLAHPAPR